MQTLALSKQFLRNILSDAATSEAMDWLEAQVEKISKEGGGMKFFLAFSQSSRHFPKDTLNLSDQARVEARNIRTGFQPGSWTILQTARTLLLLEITSETKDSWIQTLDRLFESADMHEQEALYAALPLLPFPEKHTHRAAEGIRTNITSVFDAVALENPYPSEFLNEPAWNQLLLKAIFMQRPLYRIYGADRRANVTLAKTLVDYVHERWSAGRSIMPELWRFLAPFVDEEILGLLESVLDKGDDLERKAAALACSAGEHPGCVVLLSKYPDLQEMIGRGDFSWDTIGEEYDKQR